MDRDPLSAPEARKLIRAILDSGTVVPTRHFKEECRKDNLTIVDAENILRCGIVREPECENGSWRYQVETPAIRVVVVFDNETTLILITAMRLRS
jgi:hypothetical protein